MGGSSNPLITDQSSSTEVASVNPHRHLVFWLILDFNWFSGRSKPAKDTHSHPSRCRKEFSPFASSSTGTSFWNENGFWLELSGGICFTFQEGQSWTCHSLTPALRSLACKSSAETSQILSALEVSPVVWRPVIQEKILSFRCFFWLLYRRPSPDFPHSPNCYLQRTELQ